MPIETPQPISARSSQQLPERLLFLPRLRVHTAFSARLRHAVARTLETRRTSRPKTIPLQAAAPVMLNRGHRFNPSAL